MKTISIKNKKDLFDYKIGPMRNSEFYGFCSWEIFNKAEIDEIEYETFNSPFIPSYECLDFKEVYKTTFLEGNTLQDLNDVKDTEKKKKGIHFIHEIDLYFEEDKFYTSLLIFKIESPFYFEEYNIDFCKIYDKVFCNINPDNLIQTIKENLKHLITIGVFNSQMFKKLNSSRYGKKYVHFNYKMLKKLLLFDRINFTYHTFKSPFLLTEDRGPIEDWSNIFRFRFNFD